MTAKRAAFFDVDNTLIKGSTIFFLGRGMYQRGFFTKKEISAFILANVRYRMTGQEKPEEINKFKEAAQNFVKGHRVDEIRKIGNDVYEKYVSPKIWAGTIAIAKEHLNQGLEVWLVTAAPQHMAELIAEKLGFTGALGTVAEVSDGKYTGKMIGEMLHGKSKAAAVKKLAEERNIDLANSYAYSDSHFDIPLLTLVGNPKAINPDTLLRVKCHRENWAINDFRRARRLNELFGPFLARALSAASYLKPPRRQR